MYKLFMAFACSIPKLLNVIAILSLVLFLFAVLGVNVLTWVKALSPVDQHANSRGFYRKRMTLIRSYTR